MRLDNDWQKIITHHLENATRDQIDYADRFDYYTFREIFAHSYGENRVLSSEEERYMNNDAHLCDIHFSLPEYVFSRLCQAFSFDKELWIIYYKIKRSLGSLAHEDKERLMLSFDR